MYFVQGEYIIISCRGTNEPQVNPRTSQAFIHGVMMAVPGGRRYEVVYPATFTSITSGPGVAADDIARKVSEIVDRKVILFGYSQGAMGVVEYLNRPTAVNISAIVLYGNPYWSSQTAGVTNAGSALSGSGTFGGRMSVPERFKEVTRDYCNAGDVFCAGGTSLAVHLGYPASPAGPESIQFVVGKLSV